MRAGFLIPALAALALAFTAPAVAQTPAVFAPVTCAAPVDDVQEAQDERLMSEAIGAFRTGGYAALRTHLSTLRQIMNRAPDCYPLVEQRSGETLIRADNQPDYLEINGQLALGGNHRIAPNVYPQVALMLGSYSVEMQNNTEAVRWLDRGLAWQPYHEGLNIERTSALLALHRPEDALAGLQRLIDEPALGRLVDRARLTRNAGVTLVELNRLDEAEASLNESIRLQPDNPVARSELEYIAGLRRGGPRTEIEINSPGTEPQPRK